MTDALAAATETAERYVVIRRLAVGGMGEIFLARQAIAGTNRLVVLKRLLPELAEDPQQVAMFVDEARIASNLTHPGIVHVHEFGRDALGHFIVMEYVAGRDIGRVMKRAQTEQRAVAPRFGAYVMYEVARALDHAHRACDSDGKPLEIVHRDISPSNVLVSFRGDVKLMDFGIARAANRSHRTNDGSIRGKFAYMAPEQIEGGEVDARSDMFAAGVVLWELTLHRRLFEGPSDFEVIRATLEQPIARPTAIDPYYPPALEELVMAALERDPARRLASAAELAAGLRAFLRTQPTDRDDVAALVGELFPADAAESVKLEQEHTRPIGKDAVPTVVQPQLKATPPERDARARPSRRGRWLALGLAAAAAGGGAYAIWGRAPSPVSAAPGDASPPPGKVATVVPDAAEPPPPREVEPPADAPAAAHASGHRKQPPVVVAAPDAAPPAEPAPVAAIARSIVVNFAKGSDRSDTSIHDPRCGSSVGTSCSFEPGTQTLQLSIVAGASFSVTFEVHPDDTRCLVDLGARKISCLP